MWLLCLKVVLRFIVLCCCEVLLCEEMLVLLFSVMFLKCLCRMMFIMLVMVLEL